MSNIVPATGGYMTIAADDFALLQTATADMGTGGETYLKHDGNSGEFSYGASDTELAEGTQMAMDMASLMRGYVCWKDSKPVEQVMVSFRDGAPPPKHTLTDHGPYEDGDGWSDQTIMKFKLIDGDDAGVELTFKASTQTKINALGRVIKDFSNQYKSNMGLIPVVEIGNNEFESKAKGARGAKKFAPIFKIVHWATEAELAAGQGDDATAYDEDGESEASAPSEVEGPAEPAAEALVPAPTRRAPASAAAPTPGRATAGGRPAPAAAAPKRGRF